MSVLELIRQRRSQRVTFLEKPIEASDIERLIEAARWAPSPFNTQPWELLFVTDPEKKRALGALTREAIVEQFKDARFLEKVAFWTRISVDEWKERGDGVFLNDQLPEDSGFARAVAPFLMKHAKGASLLGRLGAGNAPGKATERMLVESPLITLIFRNRARQSPGTNGETWTLLGFGAMFQNVLLTATERNIGAQFVNAALEEPKFRERIRQLFHAPESHEPMLMFRMGYLDDLNKLSVRLSKEQIVRYNDFEDKKP